MLIYFLFLMFQYGLYRTVLFLYHEESNVFPILFLVILLCSYGLFSFGYYDKMPPFASVKAFIGMYSLMTFIFYKN